MPLSRDRLWRLMLRWELQRLIYNLVLLATAALVPSDTRSVVDAHFLPGYWVLVALSVIGANAFYCLGPLVEVYALVFLRWELRWGRHLLFGAGMLFSFLWMGGYTVLRALF